MYALFWSKGQRWVVSSRAEVERMIKASNFEEVRDWIHAHRNAVDPWGNNPARGLARVYLQILWEKIREDHERSIAVTMPCKYTRWFPRRRLGPQEYLGRLGLLTRTDQSLASIRRASGAAGPMALGAEIAKASCQSAPGSVAREHSQTLGAAGFPWRHLLSLQRHSPRLAWIPHPPAGLCHARLAMCIFEGPRRQIPAKKS